MQKIVLLSCVKSKRKHKAKAKHLYCSTLFINSYAYACRLKPDRIFILSAKHGVVDPEQEIAPYDETLHTQNASQRKQWSQKVLAQLGRKTNLQQDRFIILAGKRYYQDLAPHIRNYQLPLDGLSFGNRLSFLKEKLQDHG